jgi:hypothetical protein
VQQGCQHVDRGEAADLHAGEPHRQVDRPADQRRETGEEHQGRAAAPQGGQRPLHRDRAEEPAGRADPAQAAPEQPSQQHGSQVGGQEPGQDRSQRLGEPDAPPAPEHAERDHHQLLRQRRHGGRREQEPGGGEGDLPGRERIQTRQHLFHG